ncbi:hypothetical protein BDZ91DRAFT_743563 [Kalaharituber pfeilii]|nr:hypothetical protein BDZ91DRAFT_743563 [Kalaharituber pfeilii]
MHLMLPHLYPLVLLQLTDSRLLLPHLTSPRLTSYRLASHCLASHRLASHPRIFKLTTMSASLLRAHEIITAMLAAYLKKPEKGEWARSECCETPTTSLCIFSRLLDFSSKWLRIQERDTAKHHTQDIIISHSWLKVPEA